MQAEIVNFNNIFVGACTAVLGFVVNRSVNRVTTRLDTQDVAREVRDKEVDGKFDTLSARLTKQEYILTGAEGENGVRGDVKDLRGEVKEATRLVIEVHARTESLERRSGKDRRATQKRKIA